MSPNKRDDSFAAAGVRVLECLLVPAVVVDGTRRQVAEGKHGKGCSKHAAHPTRVHACAHAAMGETHRGRSQCGREQEARSTRGRQHTVWEIRDADQVMAAATAEGTCSNTQS